MEQGRETRSGDGSRAQAFVERTIAQSVGGGRGSGLRETRARDLVDAVAEMFERDRREARATLLELAVDGEAQRRLTAWLGCRNEWIALALLGGIAAVVEEGAVSAEGRDRLVAALLLWF